MSAYADLVLFLSGQRDVNVMLKIFEDFRLISSAKVNQSKSVAMLVGKWSDGESN